LRFSASGPVVAGWRPRLRDDAGFDLQRLHDGLEGFADFGGGGGTLAGVLFKTTGDHAFQLWRNSWDDEGEVFRVEELDSADGLEIFALGTGEGVASAD